MATPTFVGAGSQGVGVTTTINIQWPAGVQINDIGLLVVETSGNATGTPSIQGWTVVPGFPVTDVATTSGSKLFVFWQRTPTDAPANVPLSTTGFTDHFLARIFAFRGCVTTGNPWDVVTSGNKTSASSTATVPAVTTTVADTLIFGVASRPTDVSDTGFFGNPTNGFLNSLTDRGEAGTSTNNGGGFVAFTGIKATAGSTGTTTISMTATVTNTYAVVALKGAVGLNPLDVFTGAFSLTGVDAEFFKSILMDLDPASFNFTLNTADLLGSFLLLGQVRSFTFASSAAILGIQLVLLINSVAFNLGLQSITGLQLKALIALVQSYTLTRFNGIILGNRRLDSNTATFTIVSGTKKFSREYALQVIKGALNSTYSVTEIALARVLTTIQRQFVTEGYTALINLAFLQKFVMSAQATAFVIQTSGLTLLKNSVLSAYRSLFRLRGTFPDFTYKAIDKPLYLGRPPGLKTPLLGMRTGQGRVFF